MRGTGSTSEIRSFAGTLALVALAGFGGAATVLSIDMIVDAVAQGGLGPAASRPQHVAVALVEPENEQTHRLFGFDWMSEETRAEGVTRAAATGLPAVVGPVSLLTNARPGIFVVHSVRDRDGNVIGYLSSGVDLDRLTQTIGHLARLDDVSLGVRIHPTPCSVSGGKWRCLRRSSTIRAQRRH